MVYDEGLAERIREVLEEKAPFEEKKMFGGVAFMVRGNMCVGVVKDDLMVRVGKENHQEALERTGARTMDFTGRPMRGYVFVEPDGISEDEDLGTWIDLGLEFNQTLAEK